MDLKSLRTGVEFRAECAEDAEEEGEEDEGPLCSGGGCTRVMFWGESERDGEREVEREREKGERVRPESTSTVLIKEMEGGARAPGFEKQNKRRFSLGHSDEQLPALTL